ncbi:MAG: response regulator [Bdellovibrionota bacterium]
MFPAETVVLVIDDMISMRKTLTNIIKDFGLTKVTEAQNGLEALSILNNNYKAGNPVGLVLCDWHMPEMSGLDLLKSIRERDEFKALPFLMITAENDKSKIIEAIKCGVSNYMVKPFSPSDVKAKLTEIWKKHNPGK